MSKVKKFTVISFLLFILFSSSLEGSSIPCLCYHQVKPTAKGKFELSTQIFREQLSLLKKRNYQTINSQQFLDYLNGKDIGVKKPIVLTFDDGYLSVFQHARPIMKEFGYIGVACVYPSFIGCSSGMKWEQLKTLASEGWSIECHSYDHSNFIDTVDEPETSGSFFSKQIQLAKNIVEQKTGKKSLFFTWPFGVYTIKAEEFARKVGFSGAFTVDGGGNYPGLDPFRVKRQVIYGNDNLEKFQIKVEMGGLPLQVISPLPGQILDAKELKICAKVLDQNGNDPLNSIWNVKVTDGKTSFSFDKEKKEIRATLVNSLKSGTHFVDVYFRDKTSGITSQNGWFFIIE
ncbi:MAG: polysaccharide deacetylase family protein [Candidatus Riflebacteria bacterium]|nr:polysaccharide deacetylase family protein [Candidatus Riflebacteria bacterium]